MTLKKYLWNVNTDVHMWLHGRTPEPMDDGNTWKEWMTVHLCAYEHTVFSHVIVSVCVCMAENVFECVLHVPVHLLTAQKGLSKEESVC